MRNRKWSRRDVLKSSGALAVTALFAEPAKASLPPPTSVTPELIEAARKEGKLSYYSALELNVAERLGKAFEAKYPGITVHVERSGAERIYQRIAQEQGSGINAVDVANSTDPRALPRLEIQGLAGAVSARRCRQIFPGRSVRPGRHLRDILRVDGSDRLQFHAGETRGCAEKLCRPARSEMAGQDRQGASRLFRRDHDRDLRAVARSGMVVFRRSRQAEGDAGAVGGRSAEEAAAWRAGRDGRRQ